MRSNQAKEICDSGASRRCTARLPAISVSFFTAFMTADRIGAARNLAAIGGDRLGMAWAAVA